MSLAEHRLVRLVDIAEMGGVSRQRADRWTKRADFPAPVERWRRGAVWDVAEVRVWLARPRVGHRPQGSSGVRSRTLGLTRVEPGRYVSGNGAIEIVRLRDDWLAVDRDAGWTTTANTFESAKTELARHLAQRSERGGSDVG